MQTHSVLRYFFSVALLITGVASSAYATPPDIVSTTINASSSGGRYQLQLGQSYTVRVTVAAGNVTYDIRLEGHNISSTLNLSPTYRDDTIPLNSGNRVYTFTVTPGSTGDYQVAFHLRDRGTNNVFDIDGGVAVHVFAATPPDIVSTTINASSSGGRYQLQLGQSYTVTVTVAAGNVTYDIRVEGHNISGTLNLNPVYRDDTIDRNSGNHTYPFTITPNTAGDYQVAFHLRDRGTNIVFDIDGGVAVHVYTPTPPDIVGTTIDAPISGGKYQLQLGQSYPVTVTVAAGNVTYAIRVEGHNIPGTLNLNPAYRDDTIDRNSGNHTYPFTITPNTAGDYQVAFHLRDRGTNIVFDIDGGVAVHVYTPTPPDIVGTTIDAPISGGKYQLQLGQSYPVTVTVAAGNVTYAIRVEGHNISGTLNLNPAYRDDTIDRNSGNHTYSFTITPNTAGDYQVAFHLRDRGTNIVFDIGPSVAVHVYTPTPIPPDIVNTTINASVSGGKYQLELGQTYTVTVTVVAGNVTYDIRVEGHTISSTLNLSPTYRDDTIPLDSGNHTYTFSITPNTTGDYQVAFHLRDRGTNIVFDVDGGVAVHVHDPRPHIVSTTIDAPDPGGKYQLVIGKRYLIRVRIRPGTVPYKAGVEQNDEYSMPESANLHNPIFYLRDGYVEQDYITFPAGGPDIDFLFTITPTDSGDYQVAFQLREDPTIGTGLVKDSGVAVHCFSDLPGVHGSIISKKSGDLVQGAYVYLSDGSRRTTPADGSYQFEEAKSGTYNLMVRKSGYSSFKAVNLACPRDGIRVDCALEEEFPDLKAAGIDYLTYDERSYGSVLIHVIRVPRAFCISRPVAANIDPLLPWLHPDWNPYFETGEEILSRLSGLVAINGGYFTPHSIPIPPLALDGKPQGYFYVEGPFLFEPFSWQGTAPTLGISGKSGKQKNEIVDKTTELKNPDWKLIGGNWLWDDDNDGVSDVDYALQCGPTLLKDDALPDDWAPDHRKFWARTVVGVDYAGSLILAVADGEGLGGDINGDLKSPIGPHGACLPQMGEFFKNILQAKVAMSLDGGGSSQFVVNTAYGPRTLNTLTAERGITPNGRVHNYVVVGSSGLLPRPNLNGDIRVNFLDLALFGDDWMNVCLEPSWCDGSDLDQSGMVGLEDLWLFGEYWLEGTTR